MTARSSDPAEAERDGSQEIVDATRMVYEELVSVRNRLAGLPPASKDDFENVLQALHEVFWYLMTPPAQRKTDLPLPEAARSALIRAARDRNADLHTAAVALLAVKLSQWTRRGSSDTEQLQSFEGLLDETTFDYRRSKRATRAILRDLKSDIDARIAYVTKSRPNGYRFIERPETYRARANKKETPIAFFERVYGAHVRRGLTQADLRRIDPAFYNVLHVWCVRHERKMSSLVPSTRRRLK
jgi:hypothetical protein